MCVLVAEWVNSSLVGAGNDQIGQSVGTVFGRWSAATAVRTTLRRGEQAADARNRVHRHSARRPALLFWAAGGPAITRLSDAGPCRGGLLNYRVFVLVVLQVLSGPTSCGGTGEDSWSENPHRADVHGLCADARTEQLEVLDCILNVCISIYIYLDAWYADCSFHGVACMCHFIHHFCFLVQKYAVFWQFVYTDVKIVVFLTESARRQS